MNTLQLELLSKSHSIWPIRFEDSGIRRFISLRKKCSWTQKNWVEFLNQSAVKYSDWSNKHKNPAIDWLWLGGQTCITASVSTFSYQQANNLQENPNNQDKTTVCWVQPDYLLMSIWPDILMHDDSWQPKTSSGLNFCTLHAQGNLAGFTFLLFLRSRSAHVCA